MQTIELFNRKSLINHESRAYHFKLCILGGPSLPQIMVDDNNKGEWKYDEKMIQSIPLLAAKEDKWKNDDWVRVYSTTSQG